MGVNFKRGGANMGFLSGLTLLLIGLKLGHVIHISWLWIVVIFLLALESKERI